ncbi:MAG: type II toxin-antitoxin system RelB/DinJ family antitoxin [Candidatus Kuenenbacteria bacterium]
MSTKSMDQIQVRIDTKTKQEARKILEKVGLDISSAVKIFFRQIINTRSFPCEIRDENGFRPHKAKELRKAIIEAEASTKSFSTPQDLIKDLLS